ncbi:MAG: NADH-quinone oxidoreductase subunit L [Polyangiaceae bacterium]|nr:NADH-quinone oxidoreductase subunit L [Polyangiaceae bacterium]
MQTLFSIFPQQQFALLALIMGLPLLGAFVNGVFGRRLGREGVRLMALAALFGSFAAALVAFFMLRHHAHELGGGHGESAANPRLVWTAWKWMTLSTREAIGTTNIDVSFAIDPLSATMMLVVTGVGSLIHLYASSYMWDDPSFHRFFCYLNLFVFSMLVLILGDSLPLLFVGWEGVGLCSYLLIGFWFSEEANAAAGKKAFIANRIGDFGLLVGMAMLLYYTGALDFEGIRRGAGGLLDPKGVQVWPLGAGFPSWLIGWLPASAKVALTEPRLVYPATLCGLALFLGCAGKSAQLPLYVWLPDAMAGPTPVSALIHAATMVTAGVYLVCRLSFVFVLSPAVMATVATVGALTALFAATIGLVQHDLKKVLAYSTVSQLGYMFLGVGSGAFVDGFFHVFTHAFFKACLFLGAGSVIHAMHARIHDTEASQDMRNMGGLRKHMPLTHWTYLASCVAIAGVPPFAGFFSKDEILAKAFESKIKVPELSPLSLSHVGPLATPPEWLGTALYVMGVLGAVMTAFYMFRTYFLTFWGDFKGWKVIAGWKDPHAHDAHSHDDHGHAAHDDHGHAGHDDHGHAAHAGHDDHGHDAHGHDDHPSFKPGTGRDHLDGPEPHESPLPMTIPLVILATFALGAGFLNAVILGETLHLPELLTLEHWLAPVFASTHDDVVVPAFEAGHAWMLAVPGLLAAVGGIGFAYYAYVLQNGEPTRRLAAAFPKVHALLLDKWRVDEFYEATVIGAVDELANTAVVADKWLIDGLIAKASAALVGLLGAGLRLFQTGKVQVYAAGMVIGTLLLGTYLYLPHAEASVTFDAASGSYRVQAAPGLGYRYRWDADGDGKTDQVDSDGDGRPDDKFGDRDAVEIKVEPNQTKQVTLEVQNAFLRHDTRTITVSRPATEQPGQGMRPTPRPGG